MAGASEVDITPPVGVPLAGYGDRLGRPSTGVHDPIKARVLVLDNGDDRLAIVSCDLCGVSRDLREGILSRLPETCRITSENLLLAATHTHAAQGACIEFRPARIVAGAYDADLKRDMTEKIAGGITEASGNLSPAKIGWGRTEDDRLSANRRVNGGPIDPEIGVLRVDRAEGDAEDAHIAVVCNFSAHPTVMGGESNMLISAEWPGVYSRIVSEKWGGVALFLNGSEGNQRPGNPTNASGWERVEGMGATLADDVLSLLPGIEMRPEAVLSARTKEAKATSPLGKLMPKLETLCQVFEIGDTLWMGLPGETCVEIGKQLKDGARAVGYELPFLISCANGHTGYLVPREYFEHPDYYETAACFIGVTTEALLLRTFAELSPRPGFPAPPARPDVPAGSVMEIGGMQFLKVSGGPYELGLAHGKAMRDRISGMNRSMFLEMQKESSDLFGAPWGNFLQAKWLDPSPLFASFFGYVSRRLYPYVPEAQRLEVEGIADGAEMAFDRALAMNVGLTLMEQEDKKELFNFALCTNVVAFGEATKSGQLVLGRNLDWGFGETLSEYGCLVLFEPDDGHRFFSVGWPGHCGTLTAMNEAGITVTVDSIAAPKDTGMAGVPIMVLLREIAQHASNLGEAVDTVKSTIEAGQGTCGYHIVIADGNAKDARVVEVSAHHYAVRKPVDGVLLGAAPWQTDQQYFEGPLPSEEVPRTDGSSQHRYGRAKTLCETHYGQIDVEKMKTIMGDHLADKQGLQNICNDQTIQSVIFLPAEGKMWVAQGTIPAPNGGYVEVSF